MKIPGILRLVACVAASSAVAAQAVYTPPTPLPMITWPYTDFGKPGVVVLRRHDPLLGTSTITFASGSRLIVKPTKISPGVVDIDIALGTGRAGAPASLAHALWATTLMPIGGTAKLSYAELDQWQQHSGKSVNITFVPGIRAYHLQGEVPAAEIDTEMQLLTAYARDPGFRDEQVQKIASIAPLVAAQIASSPSSVFLRTAQRALLGPDSRYGELPASEDLITTTGTEMAPLLRSALDGPADVTIVGDISLEAAIDATGRTIAAGADRPVNPPPAQPTAAPALPGQPIVVHYASDTREAWYGAYWPLADYEADPRSAIVAEVAAALIQGRPMSEEPASPGFTRPIVRATDSLEVHNGGALGIVLQIQPDEAPGLEEHLVGTIRTVVKAPIDIEALKNAKMIVLAAHASAQKTNSWWRTRLSLVLRDPKLELALVAAGNITTVTAQEVQGFLHRKILARRPIVVELLPGADSTSNPNARKRSRISFDRF